MAPQDANHSLAVRVGAGDGIAVVRLHAKRLSTEWPFALVASCILFMLYPAIGAEFGIVDDHEIAYILGRANRVSAGQILPFVQSFASEADGRFRPGYHLLRILEAFFVGGNAHLWHLDRIILAFASALTLYYALRILLAPFVAGVVTLLFFSGYQNVIWVGIVPQESYGVPLVMAGLAYITATLREHHWQPVRLFPGFALLWLAGFIKESFIPILPGVLAFIYGVIPLVMPSMAWRSRRLTLLDAVIVLFLAIGVGVQTWGTIAALRTYGHVYAGTLSAIGFLSTAKQMLILYSKESLWFLPIMAGLPMLLPRNRRDWCHTGWRAQLIRVLAMLLAGGVLILVPQLIVYGSTGMVGRYLTPGNLFVVFSATVGFYLLSGGFGALRHHSLTAVVAGMLLAVTFFRVLQTHGEANGQALSSRQFQETLTEISKLKTEHPELPLLFYSERIQDYERIWSVATFLSKALPEYERPFLADSGWQTATSPLESRLANSLRNWSREGNDHFAKISAFPRAPGECIGVVFSGASENCRCKYVYAKLWQWH